MAMQKEDLEQVIKEDLYREADAIQKKIDASGVKDVPNDLKKNIRLKLQERIDTYEEEQIYAGLSEEDREALRLGRKLQKEQAAAKTAGRKRRWKVYAASAAAAVLVLAVGMTSIGGPERIVSVIEQIIGERKVIKVNSDEGNKVSENEDEKEAYLKIKKTFGIEPVRLFNQKEGMEFMRMDLDNNLQVAEMIYQYEDTNLWYIISTGYYGSSFGFDVEDIIIEQEEIEVKGNNIELTVYHVKEEEKIKCSAFFKYKGLEYFLVGYIDQQDFKNILKNLFFS